MKLHITGSGFPRAEKCPPSTFLPGVQYAGSEYAKIGSAVHRFLVLAAEVGREAALELIDKEFRSVCASIDFTQMPHGKPGEWAFEVAFEWNTNDDTARELYRGSGERKYPPHEEGIYPGTADIVGLTDLEAATGATVIILDVKTGWTDLGDAAKSLQLGFYAVAAAMAYRAVRAVVGFIRLVDGEPRFFYGYLDEIDLAAMKERLLDTILSCEESMAEYEVTQKVTPVVGAHCRYCPAYTRCPANATLLAEVVKAVGESTTQGVPELTNETAPRVLQRIQAVKKVVEMTEEAVREYARAHPFDLPDGKRFGAVAVNVETIIPEEAVKVLPAEIYAEAAKTETSITKTALEEAIGARAPKGKKAGQVRDTLAALRKANATTVKTHYEVKAFKPKDVTD